MMSSKVPQSRENVLKNHNMEMPSTRQQSEDYETGTSSFYGRGTEHCVGKRLVINQPV